MYLKNGIPFDMAKVCVIDNERYPAGYFTQFNEEQLKEYGITIVPDPVFKDERFYSNSIGENGEVISVARPLQMTIDVICSDIKQYRDDLMTSGGIFINVNEEPKWFHSDVFSRTQYGVILNTEFQLPVYWKTMDGSEVELTEEVVTNLRRSLIYSDNAIFQAAKYHIEAVEKMATVEQIIDYNWKATGWPKRFEKKVSD